MRAWLVRRKVRRGAAVLDDYFLTQPGRMFPWSWDQGLDLGTLDIESGGQCVLGQLFGSFSAGLVLLGVGGRLAARLGFVADGRTPHRVYARDSRELTEAWRDLVTARRIAEGVAA
jgi:hypothetical protein